LLDLRGFYQFLKSTKIKIQAQLYLSVAHPIY